jgi:hypothetical protein
MTDEISYTKKTNVHPRKLTYLHSKEENTLNQEHKAAEENNL